MAEVPPKVIEHVCNVLQEIADGKLAIFRAKRKDGKEVDVLAVQSVYKGKFVLCPIAELLDIDTATEEYGAYVPRQVVRVPHDVVPQNGAMIQ